MLFGILLTVNIIICLALIAVVLLQRSEGGALGMGGGPTGFMSARGAGDLLTRITWILFGAFLVVSLALTLISGRQAGGAGSVTDSLKIDSVDPNSLITPAAPAAPAAPTGQPAPIQAPLPSLNPLLPAAPVPAAPAAPAAPAQ